jgi:2-iminoacetate synthase
LFNSPKMYNLPEKRIRKLLDGSRESGSVSHILGSISPENPADLDKIAALLQAGKSEGENFDAIIRSAGELKKSVFGSAVKIFVPLYFSNECVNRCLYCGFNAGNKSMPRKTLTTEEFKTEMETVLGLGYRVIELVTSESPAVRKNHRLPEFIGIAKESMARMISPDEDSQLILMSWLLSDEEFAMVRKAGLENFYLWQETYDREIFMKLHPKGTPKSTFDERLGVFDRAVESGIKNVGIGILYGLAPWEFDLLSLIDHGKYLQNECGANIDALGLPRFKHAEGAKMVEAPYPVSDDDLRLAVALYRLAFPNSHVFLNTREKLPLLQKLLNAGGSEMNIACSVFPGGYTNPQRDGQFDVYNYPTEKTIKWLRENGFQPTYVNSGK